MAKIKRKGAYEYERDWHQNHSALIVPMAAEAALVRGEDISEFIHNHDNLYDFMLRTKVPRSSRLVLNDGFFDTPLQNITRYYVSERSVPGITNGLVKIMPPTKNQIAKYKEPIRRMVNAEGHSVYSNDESSYWQYVQAGYKYIDTVVRDGLPPDRRIGISVGWNVQPCNDILDATAPGDYSYYIEETKKLVEPLL